MPAIDNKTRTLRFKIVYCGTPLSGKTTNLRQIHAKLDPQGRSDLVSLSTSQDRTLFFDFLAVDSRAVPGYSTSFHLYTVPGQVTYNATLQLVLRQADGVVFVADSQMDRQRDNLQAFQALEANLRIHGSGIERLPLVLQYNKRDLPNLAPVEYMEYLLNNRPVPHLSFEAEAYSGRNVLATLNAITQAVVARFQQAQEQQREPLRDLVMA
ncbi:MAG: GTPase domain-containing protein [Prosthecobacter sp.]|jgi:signal recognition particle receptor subunit beta|nr:GTPase domain-containing protein [Prosthecobacter sp.]